MTTEPLSHPGSRPALLWLSVGIAMAVVPHTFHIPLWSSIVFAALLALRLLLPEYRVRRYFVNAYIYRLIIGIIIFTGVFITYGTMVGRDAGVTLLVLLGGMKLLEIKSERDYFISTYIGFLLILTNFFYSQVLPVSLYLGLTLLVLIAALISFNDRLTSLSLSARLKTASTLFLHALPLMVLMFLLFPRINGPLWGLPKDAQSGMTGIDDEMSPGSISQLILSDEVAFRVSFEGNIPDKSSLYWRGPVLWYTDGFKWVPDRPQEPDVQVLTDATPVNYTVTLEPTDKNWLYALDIPAGSTNDSYLAHDLQLRTKKPVIKRTRYEMSSYPDYVLLSNDPEELQKALQLPGSYHEKTIALAQSWRDEGLNDTEMVERALSFFNEQAFYYTLTPPVLINDTVDEFLFDTRQGFCEHYASAFTVLMRAAGIPARVVTGYQGGTVNPVGSYLIVNQRDAHAWTEVWLGADRGWVRVDPTSAVSPSRVTDGIESAIPDTLMRVPLGLYNNSFARQVWERMNNTFDAINNRWNQWVLGYDRNRQSLLLNRIGVGDLDYEELLTGLIGIVTLCLIAIAWMLFRQARHVRDRSRRYYDRFRKRLARVGIQVYEHEGPRDLARRATAKRADLADMINQITDTYVGIRYQNREDLMDTLKVQINSFRPRKRVPH